MFKLPKSVIIIIMDRLLQWYNSKPNIIKAALIFFVVAGAVSFVFLMVNFQMRSRADRLMEPYSKSDMLIQQTLKTLRKADHLSRDHFNIIEMQQQVMNTRKMHHLELAKTFFQNYYGVLIVTMILSCFGGIILFIMINKGWSNAGITLQSLFLSMVICVTFFGFFPQVFQQEKNFTANLTSYMDYTKTELTVLHQLSYLNTRNFFENRVQDPVTSNISYSFDSTRYFHQADSIINTNVGKMNELMNYVLTMEADKIQSMEEISRMLHTFQTGQADTASVR